MTTVILWVMHYIPGLRLRGSEEAEILGIDDAYMGEFAYDYVGLEAEIGHDVERDMGAVGGAREPDHSHVKQVASTQGSDEAVKEKEAVVA
jgi:Amt family ammonium transporter